MKQKQQRTVGDAGQAGAKSTIGTFEFVLVDDVGFYLFPVHAERWIRKHVIEFFCGELIVGQGVAEFDKADVLALNQHVGFTDGVGFRV